jgi:hypothetical protein
MCKTVILPVIYGCETWSLTLREEHRLRMFENKVGRRVFGCKREKKRRNGENFIMRKFVICSLQNILFF